ncbi:hypothetical protein F5878DRAFT_667017 [Lentinula raphanica]|uniref:Uncharacterized protein n=1 Tax=Lentinula raphanica TaxID=153919 RepID=A0AA38NWK0_9AGAR|nr:hypothetical protein F5878DRAFT_667017 [Lentinula raphanica]
MASDTNGIRISSEEATRKRQDENKEFDINDRDNLKVRLLYVNDSDMLRMEMNRLRTELDGLRKELENEHHSVARALQANNHLAARLVGTQAAQDVLISELKKQTQTEPKKQTQTVEDILATDQVITNIEETLKRLARRKSRETTQRERDLQDDNSFLIYMANELNCNLQSLYDSYEELQQERERISLEGSPHMKEGTDEVDSSSNGGPEKKGVEYMTCLSIGGKQVDVPDCGDPGRLEMGTGEVETTLEITAYGTITGRTQNTQIRNLLIGLSSRLLFDKDDQSWIQNLESLKRVEEEIFEQEQITPACSVVSELLELEEYRRWNNNLEQLLKNYFLDESLTRSEKIEDEEISWIQQQQRTLEAFLKRGYEELLAKRREVGDLQEKNEGVQETLATLQDSLRDQQTKSKELEDRLTTHREAEEERHKNFVQKAREKTDALKKKLQDLTTKYSAKSEELRSSRQEIARLQKSGQESANLVDSLRDQIETMEETYSSLQTRYDQLDADLNEQEVKARNMETAAKEKQSKQNQELKKLREQIKTLRSDQEQTVSRSRHNTLEAAYEVEKVRTYFEQLPRC